MSGTIVLLVLLGISLVPHSDAQGCATVEKVKVVNDTINGFLAEFGAKVANDSSMETFVGILNDTCDEQKPYRDGINRLADVLKTCPEIVLRVPAFGLLKFNITVPDHPPVEVNFAKLVTQFAGGVEEFCKCKSFLPMAWALKNARSMMMLDVTNGAFPVIINTLALCAPSAAPRQPSISMLIDHAINATLQCRYIFRDAGFESYIELSRMKAFTESRCATLRQADFECAVNLSRTTDFKQCIIRASSLTGDSSQKCAKYECVNGVIGKKCNNVAAMDFVQAVNLHSEEIGDEICSGTVVMRISLLLVVLAIMSYMYV